MINSPCDQKRLVSFSLSRLTHVTPAALAEFLISTGVFHEGTKPDPDWYPPNPAGGH